MQGHHPCGYGAIRNHRRRKCHAPLDSRPTRGHCRKTDNGVSSRVAMRVLQGDLLVHFPCSAT